MKMQLLARNGPLVLKISVGLRLVIAVPSLLGQVLTTDQQTLRFAENGLKLGSVSVQQAFVPSLNRVGFVQLRLQDEFPGNGVGSKMLIRLRKNAFNGEVIGITAAADIPDGNRDFVLFLFPTNIVVEPLQVYFFEPVLQAGDAVFSGESFDYEKGFEVINGTTTSKDLFFVEGIAQSRLNTPVLKNRVLTLSWAGGGILQQAPFPTGSWLDVVGQTNMSVSLSATNQMRFFRVRR